MRHQPAIAFLLCAITSAAHADPGEPPPFATLDRQDATSRAGAELSYLKTKSGVNATVFRADIYGQYVDTDSGFGGYAQLPLSFADASSKSIFGIGGLELGGIFTTRFADNARLVLHAGVVLPTASADQDAAAANIITLLARPTDFYLALPDAWSVRTGGAIVLRSGQLFARIDAGVDINATANNSSNRANAVGHLNAGLGFDAGDLALTIESSNVYANTDASAGANALDALAFGASFRAGVTRPYVAVVVGLDDDAQMFGNLVLTAGLSVSLQ